MLESPDGVMGGRGRGRGERRRRRGRGMFGEDHHPTIEAGEDPNAV